jgi:hypothetical protein
LFNFTCAGGGTVRVRRNARVRVQCFILFQHQMFSW